MVTVLCLGIDAPFCSSKFGRDDVLRVADALAGVTQQGEAAVLVASSASQARAAIEEGVKCGANEALIELALPWEAELAGVELRELVQLRTRLLEANFDRRRYAGTKLRTRVTRRDVVIRPYALWIPVPLPHVDPGLCAFLSSCSLCLAWCPVGALEGKPPKANPSKCLGCGLCTSGCPFGALEHGYSSKRLYEELYSWLSAKRVSSLVVACPRGLELLEKEAPSPRGGVLVHHSGCVAGFSIFAALQLAASGVGVLLYCPGEARRGCDRAPCVELLAKSLVELEELYEGLPLKLGESLARTPRGPGLVEAPEYGALQALAVAARYAKMSTEALEVSMLPLGLVEVDTDACTLCGACARSCLTLALRLVEEGEAVRLEFSAPRCLSCSACETACPEGALKTVRKVVPALLRDYEHYEVLASSKLARCRSCGAVLGPEKLVKRVEERLRSQGAPQHVVESVWYCSRCRLLRRW